MYVIKIRKEGMGLQVQGEYGPQRVAQISNVSCFLLDERPHGCLCGLLELKSSASVTGYLTHHANPTWKDCKEVR